MPPLGLGVVPRPVVGPIWHKKIPAEAGIVAQCCA